MEQYFALLRQCPLFQGISPQELSQMLPCLGTRHMQVKMGMGIDKSGKQKAACHIRHLCVLFRQARDFFRTAYGRHLFPINEHICPETAASGHLCPAS